VIVTWVPVTPLVGDTVAMVAVLTVKGTELDTVPLWRTCATPLTEAAATLATMELSLQLTTAPVLLPKSTVPINTHIHGDHTGGNAAIAKLGSTISGGNVVGTIGESATEGAAVIAFHNILDRMSAANTADTAPEGAWPTDTYTGFEKKMFFNGEGIEIIHAPSAHTDGDSIVFFHRSDVVSTGDIFVTETYPVIDLKRGGSIQGILDTLNRLIAMSIPADKQEGGTMFIPGHGRLCDQADVVFYQEMVTIIRDRIQDMIQKGMTLDQVKAAKPTRDYDPRYGRTTGFWTTDMFVEAVYKNLSEKPAVKPVSEEH
jgi:cyclase